MSLTTNELIIGIANYGFVAHQLQNVISVDDESKSQISVYPNPCENYINLESNINEIKTIEITDLLGNVVKKRYRQDITRMSEIYFASYFKKIPT